MEGNGSPLKKVRRALKTSNDFAAFWDVFTNCIQFTLDDFSLTLAYGGWYEIRDMGTEIKVVAQNVSPKQIELLEFSLDARAVSLCVCSQFHKGMTCAEDTLLTSTTVLGGAEPPLSSSDHMPPPAPLLHAAADAGNQKQKTTSLAWGIPLAVCGVAAVGLYVYKRRGAPRDQVSTKDRTDSADVRTMFGFGSFSSHSFSSPSFSELRSSVPIAMHAANPLYTPLEEDVMHVNPLLVDQPVAHESVECTLDADFDNCRGTAAYVMDQSTASFQTVETSGGQNVTTQNVELDEGSGKRDILAKIARLRHVRRQSIELARANEAVNVPIE